MGSDVAKRKMTKTTTAHVDACARVFDLYILYTTYTQVKVSNATAIMHCYMIVMKCMKEGWRECNSSPVGSYNGTSISRPLDELFRCC